VPTNVVAAAVSAHGSDEQRSRLLPGLLSGGTVTGWCGPVAQVAARRDGEAFVLEGSVARVEAAAHAVELLVTADGPDGRTQFLVPTDAPGVTVIPLETLDLVRRFARVDLEGVRLDATAVLGEVGGGEAAFADQLRTAVVLQCAESVGALDVVLATTLEYLGDRYSFGRPLSSYQALKHRLADLKLWLEASAAISTLAAKAVQDAADDVDEIVHAAAAYVGDHSSELVHAAVQLHGGIGVTWEHDLHLFLRRVTVNRSICGTPGEHREKVAEISLQRLEER
jgi:alkylation response protein AidB-like acyl-CoA dehydrogenase